jgi:excisionase family DNA binding protein
MKRGGRGRGNRERVDAARRQAALALGRDPDQRDLFVNPPKSSTPAPPVPSADAPLTVENRAIGVLSLGEAAVRLGLSRPQLEAMIDRGLIEALPTGYTRMIPTTEVERLEAAPGG